MSANNTICAKQESLWINLTIKEQAAASILGWDINKWEDGETPTIGYNNWENLNEIEIAAAIFIGYKEDEWNLEALSARHRRDFNKERLRVRSIWENSSDAQELPQAIEDFKRSYMNILNPPSVFHPPSINRQVGQFNLSSRSTLSSSELSGSSDVLLHHSSMDFGRLGKLRQAGSSSFTESIKPVSPASPASPDCSLENKNQELVRSSSF